MRLSHTLSLALLTCVLAGSARAADLLPADKPIPEVIDHYVEAAWKEQKVKPAALADDATIIRRLTLDLNGRIPTAAEVEAYVSSKDASKKEKLVDRLMSSPAFVRHQVNEFDVVFATEPQGRRNGGNMRDYLTRAFKENRSWDNMFRDIIVADEKEAVSKGASQFLKVRVKDLDKLTTEVSVLFFGINVSCAQCHDHPIVHDWKQDHYYGLKSFFARSYEAGQFLGEREFATVQFKTTKNETKTASLMFLTGKKVDDPAMKLSPAERKKLENAVKPGKGRDRNNNPTSQPAAPKFSARAALADLVLQNDQRDLLSRAIVNRQWHRFYGIGLVNPIDQMHSENAPSHPELLAWLARDVAANKYDLKRLTRGLVLSKAYARSTQYDGDRFPPVTSYAVARLRPMTPMQLATLLRIATSSPDRFPATMKPEEFDKILEQTESAARGLASLFEQPRDDFQISVSEALLFSNGDRIQKELLTENGQTLLAKMKAAKSPEEAINVAYRTAMSRPASEEEQKALLDHVAKRRDKLSEAYKQIAWALISSAEFRFNY